jgi:protein ImuB
MRRIVSIWFPAFPVERFIRGRMKSRHPAPPKGMPFALVEGGGRGLRLVAVNAVARGFGLSPGQRLADARAAVPDLLSEPHEPEHDMASLLGLCRWMERYSPWVAPEAPHGILLDVSGIPHLFGGEAAMLKDMEHRLAGYGFTARCAIAATIGAAWALARFDGGDLASLPVEALRIDGEAARTLRRLGLKTIGALQAIPRASLARRFRGEVIGENVLMRLDEALGLRDEPLDAMNPPSSFMAHRALMEPVISHEGLEAVLTGLVNALARDLELKAQGALRLILRLFRSDGSRASIPAGLSAPSHDPAHLLRLLKPRLEAIDAGFGIDAMTLEARETGPVIARQYGFAEDARGGEDLTQLTDRVANRHEASLAALEALESHIPERAERPVAPVAAAETAKARRTRSSHAAPGEGTAKAASPAAGRPLLIFPSAEPAAVIAAVPDGPPMRFTWRRVTRKVAKSQGPERVAPEWWRLDDGLHPRDYYVIEDDKGRRYWLYREGLYGETGEGPPQWFVHGLSP